MRACTICRLLPLHASTAHSLREHSRGSDGYGYGYTGCTRRVGGYGYDGFFFRKNADRPISCPYPYTRIPAYTRARIRIPRVTGTGRRIRVVPGGYKQTTSGDCRFEKLAFIFLCRIKQRGPIGLEFWNPS
jgi:hypothetical protein